MASKKKPKRVVLGVGYPWFFGPVAKNGGYGAMRLLTKEVPTSLLLRGKQEMVGIDPKGTGAWAKIRLVAEVLE